jgi:hypothetical protein
MPREIPQRVFSCHCRASRRAPPARARAVKVVNMIGLHNDCYHYRGLKILSFGRCWAGPSSTQLAEYPTRIITLGFAVPSIAMYWMQHGDIGLRPPHMDTLGPSCGAASRVSFRCFLGAACRIGVLGITDHLPLVMSYGVFLRVPYMKRVRGSLRVVLSCIIVLLFFFIHIPTI